SCSRPTPRRPARSRQLLRIALREIWTQSGGELVTERVDADLRGPLWVGCAPLVVRFLQGLRHVEQSLETGQSQLRLERIAVMLEEALELRGRADLRHCVGPLDRGGPKLG